MSSYVNLVSSLFPGFKAAESQPQKRQGPAGPVFSSLAHNAASEELASDLVSPVWAVITLWHCAKPYPDPIPLHVASRKSSYKSQPRGHLRHNAAP